MPQYDWKCRSCNLTVEVTRRMADSSVPPRHKCLCGKCEWSRKFAAPMVQVNAVDDQYPYKYRTPQETVRDVNGDPVRRKDGTIIRESRVIEFKDRREHDAWMNDNGYVRTRDTSFEDGASQASAWEGWEENRKNVFFKKNVDFLKESDLQTQEQS